MGVPQTGQYKMFDTGTEANPINTSIKGAQKHDANDPVDGNTNFSENVTDAQVPLFDPAHAGQITTLTDVSASLQWRGYPQTVSCYTCSFEEIDNPNNRTIIVSASALDDGVSFRVQANGTYTPYNGGISIATTKNSTFSNTLNSVGADETFVGWSFTGDGSGQIIETSTTYNHTVDEDLTIYALVRLSDAIGIDFCWHRFNSMNAICSSCPTTKTVYFDRDLYETTPIEDLIWYETPSLNGGNKSEQGYYRKKTTTTSTWIFGITFTNTIIDDTIYFVSGSGYPTPGAANVYDTCGEFIYCS